MTEQGLNTESERTLDEVLIELRDLALREHIYCEDPYYSCPKAEDGCANESRGPECDCGAEKHNAKVEKVFAEAVRLHAGAPLPALKGASKD